MALHKDMKLFEMKKFLTEEVKEQILFEIAPILHLAYSQGGYFGVPRQILCIVDFLGGLYNGFDPQKDTYKKKINGKEKTIKKIATTKKAIEFTTKIFGEIDENYKLNGHYLFYMYRHGVVHTYQPKELRLKNGEIISWLPYKGGRVDAQVSAGDILFQNVNHLVLLRHKVFPGKLFLPVSTQCLYNDLLSTIDIYVKKLEADEGLQKKWISAANEISEPEDYDPDLDSEVGI